MKSVARKCKDDKMVTRNMQQKSVLVAGNSTSRENAQRMVKYAVNVKR